MLPGTPHPRSAPDGGACAAWLYAPSLTGTCWLRLVCDLPASEQGQYSLRHCRCAWPPIGNSLSMVLPVSQASESASAWPPLAGSHQGPWSQCSTATKAPQAVAATQSQAAVVTVRVVTDCCSSFVPGCRRAGRTVTAAGGCAAAGWDQLPRSRYFDKKVAAPGVEPAPAAKRVQIARSFDFPFTRNCIFAFAIRAHVPAVICTRYKTKISKML